ncbi:MAG: sigma-70 family RNA polymerase sigma factor [Pseudomonadota bacterium]
MNGTKKRIKRTSVEAAFVESGDLLKRFLSRYLFDSRDIEDLSHEAYLRAHEAEQRQVVRNPRAFLFRIARNLALNELSRKARKITDYIDEVTHGEELGASPSMDEQQEQAERFALFCRGAANLPPQCRRAFLMRKVYGYSHKEIASQLGISASTVEKHIATGLHRCSSFMEAMEKGPPSNVRQLSLEKTVKEAKSRG